MISKKIKMLALASILSAASLSVLAFSKEFKPTYAAPSYGGLMTATIYDINHIEKNAKIKADKAVDLHFRNGYTFNYVVYDESSSESFKGYHYRFDSYNDNNKPFVFQKLTSIRLTFSKPPKPFIVKYKTIRFLDLPKSVEGTYSNNIPNMTLTPPNSWDNIQEIHLQGSSKIIDLITQIDINYTCQ